MKAGVVWYLGDTGTGKTTLAWIHLTQWAKETGFPALIIDSIGSHQFASVQRVATAEQAIEKVWRLHESVAINPTSEAEFDTLMLACLGGRRVHVLIDESAFWLDSRRGVSSPLMRLLRSHREAHACATVQLTTQYFAGDVPRAAFACNPTFFIFRNSDSRALERIETETGLDPDEVAALPDLSFLEISKSFSLTNPQKDAAIAPAFEEFPGNLLGKKQC